MLIVFLFKYKIYPDRIGIHFDGEGNFDVISDPVYGFYPFIVIAVTQGILFLVERFAKKVSVGFKGLKLSENAQEIFRGITLIWMDIMGWGISAFFSMFAFCVTWQIPEPVLWARYILYVYFGIMLLYLMAIIVMAIVSGVMSMVKR